MIAHPETARRRRAPRGAVAMACVAMLALTGCAPETDRAWAPPAWPASPVAVTVPPEPLDPSALPAFTGNRLRNDDVGIQARFAALAGTSRFTMRVEQVVREAIDARTAATGIGYAPTAAPPGSGLGDRGCVPGSAARTADEVLSDPALGPPGGVGTAVVCDIVAAYGPYLGQRLRVVSRYADATQDATVVLYAQTVDDEVVDGGGLWVEGAADALWADVIEALRRDAGALSLAPVGRPTGEQGARIAAALAGTLVAPDGSLVFTLDEGFEAAELVDVGVAATTEPLTISVPPESLPGVASAFGSGLSAAASAAEPFAPPPPAPPGLDRVDCSFVPCVALTYDDGPSSLTSGLLDILQGARAAATFYVVGDYAAQNPDPVRRAAAEGHEIGGHTWDHPSLPELGDAEIAEQVAGPRAFLQSLTGQPVATFRPPYGAYDSRVLAAAGVPAVLWSVDTRDWAGPSDDALLRSAVDRPAPGGIVLFHDTKEATVRLAPEIISGLRDRGFALVTVTQLFGGSLPAAGALHSAG